MLSFDVFLFLAVPALSRPQASPLPTATANHLAARLTPEPGIKRRQTSTTYPVTVSGCYHFSDPDAGSANGYQCSNWDGTLPYLSTSGPDQCAYSTISSYIPAPTTTNTFDTFASYPYTMTLANKAVVEFASSSVVADYGTWQPWTGVGSNTTIQAGMSMRVHGETTPAVKVGTLTRQALYTSVSNALASACPSPDSGTVTSCSAGAAVTDLVYVDSERDLKSDGKLEMDIEFVQYHSPDVRDQLLASIARAMTNMVDLNTNNTMEEEYRWAKGIQGFADVNECADETPPGTWPTVAIAGAPSKIQAVFSEQDADTNGKVDVQFMGVKMSFQVPENALSCAMAAAGTDTLALFMGGAGAIAAAFMSFDCLISDETEIEGE